MLSEATTGRRMHAERRGTACGGSDGTGTMSCNTAGGRATGVAGSAAEETDRASERASLRDKFGGGGR